jgi:hypothetical protein
MMIQSRVIEERLPFINLVANFCLQNDNIPIRRHLQVLE